MATDAAPIADLVPWKEFPIRRPPWPHADCFNPSIIRVRDDSGDAHAGKWLCSVRGASYPADCPIPHHWPTHEKFASHHAADRKVTGRSQCSHSQNWIWELDPSTWDPINGREIVDWTAPDAAFNYVGYEDLRLAWSRPDSQHQGGLIATGSTLMHSPEGAIEIAVLHLGDDYQIQRAHPIRGWWSSACQKNWMPFLRHSGKATWLYAPSGGVVDEVGVVMICNARASNADVLWGGTQLVSIDDCRFLGLGHGFDPVERGGRWYWHRAFIVDASGNTRARSRPFKLSDRDVDFACGLAVDPRSPGGDRAVVTYGVGNTSAHLAETSLGALIALCEPTH